MVLQKPLTVTATKKPSVFSRLSPEILDPCLPQGMVLEGRENPYYKFKGLGDYHKCQEALIPLLNASVPCPVQPCTFNGVYQPEINFYNSEFYGFSEFWYTMEDVYRIGGQYEADIFDAQAKVSATAKVQIRIVCAHKIAFITLPINLNIRFGCSKEPSH